MMEFMEANKLYEIYAFMSLFVIYLSVSTCGSEEGQYHHYELMYKPNDVFHFC